MTGLGIVGASKFAAFCLSAWRDVPNLRPVAVTSRTFDSAETFAREHDLVACASLDDLLARDDVHLVHVASVPSEHARQAEAALRAGKHVLVEKPPALTAAAAHALVDLAREKKRALVVDYMMRDGPLADIAARLVRDRHLGRPLRAYVVNCAGDDGLPPDHWFWDARASGGIFVEHAVHFLDLARHVLGSTGEVVGAARSVRPGTAAQVDQVTCEVCHPDGVAANHYHGFTQSHHLDRQSFRVICEQGEFTLRGWVAHAIELRAVLGNRAAHEVRNLLPEGTEWRATPVAADARRGPRRAGEPVVDVVVDARWSDARDDGAVYAGALRARMEQALRAVARGASDEDVASALALAERAAELSRPPV